MPARKPKPTRPGPKPRPADEIDGARIDLRLPEATKALWLAEAARRGMSVKAMLVEAVDGHLDTRDEGRLSDLGRELLALAEDYRRGES